MKLISFVHRIQLMNGALCRTVLVSDFGQKELIVTELCRAGKTSIILNSEHRAARVIVMPFRFRRLYSLQLC